MHDGVTCITSCEQHFESRPAPQRFFGKLAPVHAARHHHIRKEQVYLVVLGKYIKRRDTIADSQHLVSEIAERFDCVIAKVLVILDNKDGLRSDGTASLARTPQLLDMVLITEVTRQIDLDGRSLAHFAVKSHVPVRLAHETV